MEYHSTTELICPTCGRQDCWYPTITGKQLCGNCTVIMDLKEVTDDGPTDQPER